MSSAPPTAAAAAAPAPTLTLPANTNQSLPNDLPTPVSAQPSQPARRPMMRSVSFAAKSTAEKRRAAQGRYASAFDSPRDGEEEAEERDFDETPHLKIVPGFADSRTTASLLTPSPSTTTSRWHDFRKPKWSSGAETPSEAELRTPAPEIEGLENFLMRRKQALDQARLAQGEVASADVADAKAGAKAPSNALKSNEEPAHVATPAAPHVSQRFSTVRVRVIRARNLLAKDANGTSDPYAVVTVGLLEARRSSVVQRNLNPEWPDPEFVFTLFTVQNTSSCLGFIRVDLFDDDSNELKDGKSNPHNNPDFDDFLGRVEIELPVANLASSTRWYVLRQRSARSNVGGEVEICVKVSLADSAIPLARGPRLRPRVENHWTSPGSLRRETTVAKTAPAGLPKRVHRAVRREWALNLPRLTGSGGGGLTTKGLRSRTWFSSGPSSALPGTGYSTVRDAPLSGLMPLPVPDDAPALAYPGLLWSGCVYARFQGEHPMPQYRVRVYANFAVFAIDETCPPLFLLLKSLVTYGPRYAVGSQKLTSETSPRTLEMKMLGWNRMLRVVLPNVEVAELFIEAFAPRVTSPTAKLVSADEEEAEEEEEAHEADVSDAGGGVSSPEPRSSNASGPPSSSRNLASTLTTPLITLNRTLLSPGAPHASEPRFPLYQYDSTNAPVPIDPSTQIKLFGNGAEYFADLAEAIMGAKESVYIADWMLSPEVHLLRTELPLDPRYRLDNLLRFKAEQGVVISVLIYEEKLSIGLMSGRVVDTLNALHPNIQAVRHGPGLLSAAYYSHHQKFVVVDWRIAYVGGIDLCFGRYDEADHPVVDAHEPYLFPGADYYNPREHANNRLETPLVEVFDRTFEPRLPWQDVQGKFQGRVAQDVANLFVQRWTHHRFALPRAVRERVRVLIPKDPAELAAEQPAEADPEEKQGEEETEETSEAPRPTAQLLRSMCGWSGSPVIETSIHTAVCSLIRNAKHYVYIENQFFISSSDERDRGHGRFSAAAVIGAPVTRSLKSAARTRKSLTRYLSSSVGKGWFKLKRLFSGRARAGSQEEAGASFAPREPPPEEAASTEEEPGGSAESLRVRERIADALRRANRKRPHLRRALRAKFTKDTVHSTYIINKIANAMFDRLSRAIRDKEDFCIIVVLPDYPEGDFRKERYTRAVMHYELHTLCLGNESLLGRLHDKFPDVDLNRYVRFFSLRSFGFVGARAMQENVYVHSKLFMADDENMIIGSANVNDRSMLGVRDSEIAVCLERAPDAVGPFRRTLWSRHLGLSLSDPEDAKALSDPVKCARTEWDARSKLNTAIFEAVWPDAPSSRHLTLASVAAATPGPCDPMRLARVRGFVVEFPLFFLSDELLMPPVTRREGALVEESMFQ